MKEPSRLPSERELLQTMESRHGKELQARLSSASVAVCGLGGLGSHIAVSLARMGVGHLILIDFDQVDLTNLHRQQYRLSQIGQPKTQAMKNNLAEINPYLKITLHTCRVTPENLKALLQDADIICEAFDRAEEKAMLVNSVFEQFPGKYLVAASGMAGLAPADLIHTRKITTHFFLCGDETSDTADTIGLAAPRVMLCAAHQALAVVRIIAGLSPDR